MVRTLCRPSQLLPAKHRRPLRRLPAVLAVITCSTHGTGGQRYFSLLKFSCFLFVILILFLWDPFKFGTCPRTPEIPSFCLLLGICTQHTELLGPITEYSAASSSQVPPPTAFYPSWGVCLVSGDLRGSTKVTKLDYGGSALSHFLTIYCTSSGVCTWAI